MNKAFSVLQDDDKRAHYERYGAEGPSISNRPSHHHRGGYHHFDEDDMSAEDIFNMFFGGMPTGSIWHPSFISNLWLRASYAAKSSP